MKKYVSTLTAGPEQLAAHLRPRPIELRLVERQNTVSDGAKAWYTSSWPLWIPLNLYHAGGRLRRTRKEQRCSCTHMYTRIRRTEAYSLRTVYKPAVGTNSGTVHRLTVPPGPVEMKFMPFENGALHYISTRIRKHAHRRSRALCGAPPASERCSSTRRATSKTMSCGLQTGTGGQGVSGYGRRPPRQPTGAQQRVGKRASTTPFACVVLVPPAP